MAALFEEHVHRRDEVLPAVRDVQEAEAAVRLADERDEVGGPPLPVAQDPAAALPRRGERPALSAHDAEGDIAPEVPPELAHRRRAGDLQGEHRVHLAAHGVELRVRAHRPAQVERRDPAAAVDVRRHAAVAVVLQRVLVGDKTVPGKAPHPDPPFPSFVPLYHVSRERQHRNPRGRPSAAVDYFVYIC